MYRLRSIGGGGGGAKEKKKCKVNKGARDRHGVGGHQDLST